MVRFVKTINKKLKTKEYFKNFKNTSEVKSLKNEKNPLFNIFKKRN